MALAVKVPSIGESIREATVGAWKKAEGDWIEADEPLVEIESEKATLEVPSPGAGTLKKIVRKQGEVVAIGDVLADIEAGAKPAGAGKGKAAAAPVAKAAPAAVAAAAPSGAVDTSLRAAPSARRMMADAGLGAGDVEGTGRGGRIQPGDVARTLDARKSPEKTPEVSVPSVSVPAATPAGAERIVPMTPLRRTIARRLVEAQQNAAILTTFNEVDMSEVLALRERHQDRFVKLYGIKLGFMGFFVKAAIESL